MFKTYLLIAFRNIKKYIGYSFINIAGLSICTSCCILILLYIQHEFSFDKFHNNANNIYRVVQQQEGKNFQGKDCFNSIPAVLAPTVKKELPDVLSISRLKKYERVVKYHDLIYSEKRFLYAEPSFLEIFAFPVIMGNPKTALTEPNTVMITQRMAKKYFGNELPIGKVINVNGEDYRITGVLENIPDNSHFKFDFLASFRTLISTWNDNQLNSWQNSSVYTYLLLSEKSDIESFNEKLLKYNTKSFDGYSTRFFVQPLTKIHLYSDIAFEIEPTNDIRYIYLFSTIVFFILIIACFNYTNLAVARSTTRVKEVGIRKVVGASRSILLIQFLGESFIFAFSSLFLSLIIVKMFLPTFNTIVERSVEFNLLTNWHILLALLGIAVVVGFFSGIYPAIFMSSFHPIKILKGDANLHSKRSQLFRNSLIIMQFIVSIVIFICALTINNQVHFIKESRLGFESENIISLHLMRKDLSQNYPAFKTELLKHSQISDITSSYHLPMEIDNSINISKSAISTYQTRTEENFKTMVTWVDYNFIDFYKIEISQGRNFSEEFSTDLQGALLLNETSVKSIGMDDPIGVRFGDKKVIGIVKDFHFAPLHFRIRPLAVILSPDEFRYIAVKLDSNNISNTITFIEEKWKEFFPDTPFEYSFLNVTINNMYRGEQKLSQIFELITFITLLLSYLGLFGIVSFSIGRKTKEIGIRKVFGGSVFCIVRYLIKEFFALVLTGYLIAVPIAFYSMDKWLQNFSYRINIGINIFIVSGLIALFITLLSISYQTIKAARVNPVESLRYE